MENPSNFEDLLTGEHKKLVNFLEDLHITQNKESIMQAFVREVQSLQEFSFLNKNQYFAVFDHIKFLPIYISDNIVHNFGYTAQDVYKMTLLQGIKKLYWKQIPSLIMVHARGQSFRKLSKLSPIKNHEVLFCGIKFKDKWGNFKTLLAKQKFLAVDKNGEPTLSFVVAEDITPIHKGDSDWFPIADFSKDIPLIRVYSSMANTRNQLLSDRELDILRLIIQKMDGVSIANQLNISAETVKQHRKNMLAKIGAKDMTGLIHICRQANVI